MALASLVRIVGDSLRGLARTARMRRSAGPAVPGWSLLFEASARMGRAHMASLDLRDMPRARRKFAELAVLGRVPRGVRVEPAMRAPGGVPAEWLVPARADATRVVLYFHGGGFVIGGLETVRELAGRVALAAEARVLSVDYRLAPEHPFPAALDDALAAYRAVRAAGTAAARIVLAGDSAGGGLAASLLLRLRTAGEAMPAGAVLICPWTDLSESLADAPLDVLPAPLLEAMAAHYLGATDPHDPLVSPLRAELGALPPMLVQAGGIETLRPQIERFAARVRDAGGVVELDVAPGMTHVWHLLAALSPEARAAIDRIGAFVRRHCP